MRVPELGVAIFQLLDMEKTGRTQQRRLKRRSHWGRKRNSGIKVLKTFFKKRMINWVKNSWKAENDEDWARATGFNNLEVTADRGDKWLGRMAGMEARECVEVGGGVQRLEAANKDNSPNNFAIKKWDGGWRGEEGLKEKMLLKAGMRSVLCGWGRPSVAAEFTLNSKDLLWWCRQMREGKRDPLWSTMSSARKASQRPPLRKKKIMELTETMELTWSPFLD